MASVRACLDIVRYALGCSIFLGMPMEKAVFAKQLPKFWCEVGGGLGSLRELGECRVSAGYGEAGGRGFDS